MYPGIRALEFGGWRSDRLRATHGAWLAGKKTKYLGVRAPSPPSSLNELLGGRGAPPQLGRCPLTEPPPQKQSAAAPSKKRDTHFDNETTATNGLGVHVVAHVLQRTPRHRRTTTSSHASKIRPGPGIPPGYIVPIAKRSPPLLHRASFHAPFHVDPIALWGSASRSSIFLGRIDPRVLLTAKGGEREQRDARSAHAGA